MGKRKTSKPVEASETPAGVDAPAGAVEAAAIPQLSKYERYTMVQMNRNLIKGAPYNPRQIDEKNKKRLRKIIETHGLVSPLLYNKRTGNLVGGHQRLSILDVLEGTNDYLLHMAEIDVDEKREKELNIALNNTSAQGEYDLAKLEELYKDKDIDILATGFEVGDIYRMFGDAPLAGRVQEMQKLAEQYRSFREAHEGLIEGLAKRDDNNFYLVVVFQDGTAREEFLTGLELPNERHIDGKMLYALLKPEQQKLAKADYTANCEFCDTINIIEDPASKSFVCRLCKKECTLESDEPVVATETPQQTPTEEKTDATQTNEYPATGTEPANNT